MKIRRVPSFTEGFSGLVDYLDLEHQMFLINGIVVKSLGKLQYALVNIILKVLDPTQLKKCSSPLSPNILSSRALFLSLSSDSRQSKCDPFVVTARNHGIEKRGRLAVALAVHFSMA